MVDAALVRVQELIGRERIVVEHPRRMQVVLNGVDVARIRLLVDEVAVEFIEQDLKADNIERGDQIALACARLPVELRLAQMRRIRAVVGFPRAQEASSSRGIPAPPNDPMWG